MSYLRTIYFRDTDAAGVVYCSHLLSICHEAYEAALRLNQIDLHNFFRSPDFAIPIVHASINFYQPVFCGDVIRVELSPEQLTEDTFEIQYKIFQTQREQALTAKAVTKHVCINPISRDRSLFRIRLPGGSRLQKLIRFPKI